MGAVVWKWILEVKLGSWYLESGAQNLETEIWALVWELQSGAGIWKLDLENRSLDLL